MNYKAMAKQNLQEKWGMSILAMLLVFLAESATNIFAILLLPVNVGHAKFHVTISKGEKPNLEDLVDGFQRNYVGNLLALFLRMVLIILWTILLIIPGIIKAVAYSLTDFILQDDDFNEDGYEALRLSEKMMSGHKMELFMLYLSFIGWLILCMLTFGLLLVYVVPYITQTLSIYYEERKQEFLKDTGSYHQKETSKPNKEDDLFYE